MVSNLWGSSHKGAKNENENPELAMRDQLDSHGDFNIKDDGTMTTKDVLIIRTIILHQALRYFAPHKKTLADKSLELFKAGDQQAYAQNFAQGQKAFNDAIIHITKKACEWIDFDIKSYNETIEKMQKDKEEAGRIRKID